MAFSIGYIFLFALISLLPKKRHKTQDVKQNRFLIILPAYAEDKVIVESAKKALEQDYPASLFSVCIVSDHMKDSTNASLSALPLTNLIATYQPSSKAKALQLAINHFRVNKDTENRKFDFVVILDADNIVSSDFLSQLNKYCCKDTIALQAHRQAKNINTPVAILDAVSEEINNTIFRLAHNKSGLSSALIGSGMCFEYEWFANHVELLSTVGEDKELEEALLMEGRAITYLEDIPVWDEKVQSAQNFGNQRRRWTAAQLYSLRSLGKKLPQAIRMGRINFIDKFLQQLIVPRSICMCLALLLCTTICIWEWEYGKKWCIISSMLIVSLLLSIPGKLYNRNLLKAIIQIPLLVWKMIANLFHLKGAATHFIHTEHGQ